MLPEYIEKEDRIKEYVKEIHDCINKKGCCVKYHVFKKQKNEKNNNEKSDDEEKDKKIIKNEEIIENVQEIIKLYNSNPAYSKEDDDDYSNHKGLKAFCRRSSHDSKSPNEDSWIEICFAKSEEKIPPRFKGKSFDCEG